MMDYGNGQSEYDNPNVGEILAPMKLMKGEVLISFKFKCCLVRTFEETQKGLL